MLDEDIRFVCALFGRKLEVHGVLPCMKVAAPKNVFSLERIDHDLRHVRGVIAVHRFVLGIQIDRRRKSMS